MKKILLMGMTALSSAAVIPQGIPDLPTAIGVGSAEVWGDSIYYFGGSTSWGGSTRYPTIYRYDGGSWQNYASMPDMDVWGISTAIHGDSAFVYGGWSNGGTKLRIYNFVTNTWGYGTNSPHVAAYGHTMECLNDSLYLLFNGYVYKYSIRSDTWSPGKILNQNGSWLFSTVYQDEFYVLGWDNAMFYKYIPAKNQWTQLADLPYFVTGGSLRTVDDKIYYVGGSSGIAGGTFSNTLVYDIVSNQWSDANISIGSHRAYMTDVIYKHNLYVIGGLNTDGVAVADVEFIVGDIFSAVETESDVLESLGLSQNYPNPFSKMTKIRYTIPPIMSPGGFDGSAYTLKLYDVLGKEVATLVHETKPAGTYEISFDASDFPAGVYFYKLQAGSFAASKKMYIVK